MDRSKSHGDMNPNVCRTFLRPQTKRSFGREFWTPSVGVVRDVEVPEWAGGSQGGNQNPENSRGKPRKGVVPVQLLRRVPGFDAAEPLLRGPGEVTRLQRPPVDVDMRDRGGGRLDEPDHRTPCVLTPDLTRSHAREGMCGPTPSPLVGVSG